MSKTTIVTCDMCGKTEKDMHTIPIEFPLFNKHNDICIDCLHALRKFVSDYPKVNSDINTDKFSLNSTLHTIETVTRWNM